MKFNISGIKDISGLIRILLVGLSRLSLTDNFESFEVQDIEITSGSEITIQNKLTYIPSKYIILRQKGNGLVTQSDKAWTFKDIYLFNNGPDNVTVSIIFMR